MGLRDLFPRLPHDVGTIDELLNAIDANFEVEKRPIFQKIPGSMAYSPILGWATTARKDTNDALGVVSARYGVSQYKHTLSFLDELVADGQFQFTGGTTTLNGAHLYVSLTSPNKVIYAGGDTVDCHFTVSTSHDGTDSISVMCSPIHNMSQTILPSNLGLVKIRHSVHVGRRLADAAATLRKMNKVWEQHREAFERFPLINLSDDDARTYFAMLAPAKDGSEVPTRTQNVRDTLFTIYKTHKLTSRLPSCQNTLMGALVSALVFGDYYKTVRKSIVGVSEHDARIESRLTGQGAKLKADAFAGAIELMRLDNSSIFAPVPGLTP